MDKPIFTNFSPNAEGGDIMRSLAFFFMPWRWRRGGYAKKLEEEFRVRFGMRHAYVFESGRSALYAILKNLDIKKEDEVILQAFTCVAVPNSILWAGGRPIYADIDYATLNMSPESFEKKITSRTRAVVVQHTFGFPANMNRILEIARRHHLFVIEDCAHALGAEYEGKLLGTFGDAAFFSFGRDKVISSVFGGVVVTNNEELGVKVSSFQKSLPKANFLWTAKQVIHPALSVFIRSMHCKCAGRIGKVFLKLALGSKMITKAVAPQEKKGNMPKWILRKMPNVLAAFAYYQMQKLDRFTLHRKKTAEHFRNLLPDFPSQPFYGGATYLRYAIQTKNAEHIMQAAKKKDIFLGDWYRQGVAPSGVDYRAIHYDPALCPEAERAAREVVNLPTDIHIGKKEVERIVNFFKRRPTA